MQPSATAFTHRPIQQWQLRDRTLELGRRTLVMAIVNLTPDSFSDGGQFSSADNAICHAIELLDLGADILDLGAESTRPGSHAGATATASQPPTVDAREEQRRLLPVVEGILKARPNAILSIDTYKAETASLAIAAGAQIINDVSGFQWDPAMAATVARTNAALVLMHTRGKPDEWRSLPAIPPEELLRHTMTGLTDSLQSADKAGIAPERIVFDPGYGFGKAFDENYSLLCRQPELLALGRPLLIGLSRKSFLGQTLAVANGDTAPAPVLRDNASLAAMVATILAGASVVRVHNLKPSIEAARIADAILHAE